jgi:hypothetical protein
MHRGDVEEKVISEEMKGEKKKPAAGMGKMKE